MATDAVQGKEEFLAGLCRLRPCGGAIEWCDKQPDPQTMWDACEHGDWMLWLLGKLSGPPESESRRKLVLCACEVARLSLPHVPEGEDRPRVAIETAERWARGEEGVTLADVRAADAAYAADAAAAAYAARSTTLKQAADIVRRHYPEVPTL